MHVGALQIMLILILVDHHFNYNCPLILNSQSRAEITWWINNLHNINGTRLATRSESNHTFPYKLQHGSLCQPPNSTTTPMRKSATRSRSISYRCSNTPLEVSNRLCLPPFQSHSSSSQHGDSGQCRCNTCSPNLASPPTVACSIESSTIGDKIS